LSIPTILAQIKQSGDKENSENQSFQKKGKKKRKFRTLFLERSNVEVKDEFHREVGLKRKEKNKR